MLRRDDRAGALTERLAVSGDLGRDDAPAARHRLEDREGHPLPARRLDDDVRGRQPVRDVVALAGKADTVHRARLELLAVLAAPDQPQAAPPGPARGRRATRRGGRPGPSGARDVRRRPRAGRSSSPSRAAGVALLLLPHLAQPLDVDAVVDHAPRRTDPGTLAVLPLGLAGADERIAHRAPARSHAAAAQPTRRRPRGTTTPAAGRRSDSRPRSASRPQSPAFDEWRCTRSGSDLASMIVPKRTGLRRATKAPATGARATAETQPPPRRATPGEIALGRARNPDLPAPPNLVRDRVADAADQPADASAGQRGEPSSFDYPLSRVGRKLSVVLILALAAASAGFMLGSGAGQPEASSAKPGPLRVLESNPRYFTDGTGKAVYLTGSHVWWNLLGGRTWRAACLPIRPSPSTTRAYLDRLVRYNHNFFRLWTFELTRWRECDGSKVSVGAAALAPHRAGKRPRRPPEVRPDATRTPRTSHACANASRWRAAGSIYVSVMLFEGWSQQFAALPWRAAGHPFHSGNNVNGIAVDRNRDGTGDGGPHARRSAHPRGAGAVRAQGGRHRQQVRQRPLRDRERERHVLHGVAVPHDSSASSGIRRGRRSGIRSGMTYQNPHGTNGDTVREPGRLGLAGRRPAVPARPARRRRQAGEPLGHRPPLRDLRRPPLPVDAVHARAQPDLHGPDGLGRRARADPVGDGPHAALRAADEPRREPPAPGSLPRPATASPCPAASTSSTSLARARSPSTCALRGRSFRVEWFEPSTGRAWYGRVSGGGRRTMTPPVTDAGRALPAPGVSDRRRRPGRRAARRGSSRSPASKELLSVGGRPVIDYLARAHARGAAPTSSASSPGPRSTTWPTRARARAPTVARARRRPFRQSLALGLAGPRRRRRSCCSASRTRSGSRSTASRACSARSTTRRRRARPLPHPGAVALRRRRPRGRPRHRASTVKPADPPSRAGLGLSRRPRAARSTGSRSMPRLGDLLDALARKRASCGRSTSRDPVRRHRHARTLSRGPRRYRAVKVLVTGHHGYIGSVTVPGARRRRPRRHRPRHLSLRGCDLAAPGGAAAPSARARRPRRRRPPTWRASTPSSTSPRSRTTRSGDLNPELTHAINYACDDHASPGRPRKPASRRFVFASSCSMYGAAGRRGRRRGRAAAAAHAPTPSRRCAPRRTLHELAGDGFSPGLHAERDRVRRLAAPAARPRPQQPGRLGAHDRRGPHPERRDALAAARPRRGHRRLDRRRARRAGRARSTTRRSTWARTADNYRVRDLAEIVRETVAGSRGRVRRAQRSRPAQLPRRLRQVRAALPAVRDPLERASAARGSWATPTAPRGSRSRSSTGPGSRGSSSSRGCSRRASSTTSSARR